MTGPPVEHRADPLGVDASRPRLGPRTASPAPARRQTAYRIRTTRPLHGRRRRVAKSRPRRSADRR
ncbi:glycoside hydrolase family 78 protein [Streptomyces sp. NPDC054813]